MRASAVAGELLRQVDKAKGAGAGPDLTAAL